MLQGRVHLYEGVDPQALRVPTYTLRLLGCEAMMVTTAVGSLREDVGPGELLLPVDGCVAELLWLFSCCCFAVADG